MSQPVQPGEVDAEILACFFEEAREHLQAFNDGLLELEAGACDPEVVNCIFRAVHTMKGCARSVKCTDVDRLAHAAENVLDAVRSGNLNAAADVVAVLFEVNDLLVLLVDDGEQRKTPGQREDQLVPLVAKLAAVGEKQGTSEEPESKPCPAEVTLWPEPATGLQPEVIEKFRAEAGAILNEMEGCGPQLGEGPPATDPLRGLLRHVHHLSAEAERIGLVQFLAAARQLGNVLELATGGLLDVSADFRDLVVESVSALSGMIAALVPGRGKETDLSTLLVRLNECANTPSFDKSSTQADAPEPAAAGSLSTFLESANEQLARIAVCRETLHDGDESDSVVAAMQEAISALVPVAEEAGQAGFRQALEPLVDIAQLAEEGRLEFDELMLGILDEQCGELARLLDQARQEAQRPEEESRLGDILVREGGVSREAIEEAMASPTLLGDVLVGKGVASREQVEAAATAQSTSAPPKPPVAAKTTRVDQQKLDDLVAMADDLVTARNGLLYTFRRHVTERGGTGELRVAVEHVARFTTEIQNIAMAMNRMVHIKSVFQRFPRMVRDIAKANERKIEVRLSGEETELDKQVADGLGDPLVHLIRNAADHGIEPPETRRAAGKRETGLITMTAGREGNHVFIEIRDDGGGIDVGRLKTKALERGVITESQAEEMPRAEALDLIFAPGLSTAKAVTGVSGRGVGMDAVRSSVSALGGTLSLSSEDGRGSAFRLLLPQSKAVENVVLVGSGGRTYAVPMGAVHETLKVHASEMLRLRGERAITLRGQVVALKPLSQLLGMQGGPDKDRTHKTPSERINDQELIPIVILTTRAGRFGLIVDALKGHLEVIVKQLPKYLERLAGIGGATVMGDGSVVLILDPDKLFDLAGRCVRQEGVQGRLSGGQAACPMELAAST